MNQKRWGRMFALFSAICFCLSACLVQFSGGTASAAEEDAVYNGYSYQISQDGSAVITGCEENRIYLSLPSQIGSHTVSEITDHAFSGCESIQEIVVPDSVKRIGTGAFQGCTNLARIVGAKGVTSAGKSIMEGTAWERACPDDIAVLNSRIAVDILTEDPVITVPDGVEVLADNLFEGSTIAAQINLPDSAVYLGNGCFKNCTALTGVGLSAELRTIPAEAFYGCANLQTMTLPDTLTRIEGSAFGECTALNALNLNQNLNYIGAAAFEN